MKLLALLILLVLRRVEFRPGSGRADPLLWQARLDRLLLAPLPVLALFIRTAAMRLLALAVLWAAAGFLLRFGLADVLLSWPLLAVYVALLWTLAGRDTLGPDINEYLRLWYLRDDIALREFVALRFGISADNVVTLHTQVMRALFVRGYRETFAWIVVFAVTGLPGLLAFAAISAALRAGAGVGGGALLSSAAAEMRSRVDWLAVRLLGATFLLTGNSARAWPLLDSRLLDDEDPADELMADLGVAAAGVTPAVEPDVGLDTIDARGLLLRTQVVWAMLMAVSVIAGF